MEAVTRHLRDGRVREHSGPCPLALLCDDLNCSGGRDLMQQLVNDYLAAFSKGLCQAHAVKLLMLEGSICLAAQAPVAVLDGCSDPAGWLRAAGLMTPQQLGAAPLLTVTDPSSLPTTLALLTSPPAHLPASFPGGAANEGRGGVCVIIDNMSTLCIHHPPAKVLIFLEQLRANPHVSCILTGVHQDVVGSQAFSGLERQASCVLRLQSVSGLQQDLLKQITGQTPHGYISCAFKSRKAGRLRTEGSFYTLSTATGVSFIQAPSQLRDLTPAMLVTLSLRQTATNQPATGQPSSSKPPGSAAAGLPGSGGVAVAAQPAGVALAQVQPAAADTGTGAATGAGAVGGSTGAAGGPAAGGMPMDKAGGMRLTLTEQERQAREAVVLPYEHRGGGHAYQTGDWKDYLPAAAGGRSGPQHVPDVAQGAGKLGQILYVRDSDDEGGGLHDSDEDLDDDLDI